MKDLWKYLLPIIVLALLLMAIILLRILHWEGSNMLGYLATVWLHVGAAYYLLLDERNKPYLAPLFLLLGLRAFNLLPLHPFDELRPWLDTGLLGLIFLLYALRTWHTADKRPADWVKASLVGLFFLVALVTTWGESQLAVWGHSHQAEWLNWAKRLPALIMFAFVLLHIIDRLRNPVTYSGPYERMIDELKGESEKEA